MPFEMNTVSAVIFLGGGVLILWKGADLLVAGAVRLAERLGVSPLVVGLTLVAMGTSAPEVAASIAAAIRGEGDIAIGNVYGSNIANLALVGGLAALIRPLMVKMQTLCREIPAMIIVGLLLWPILHNLNLSRAEGCILLAVFAVLILITVYLARKEAANSSRDVNDTQYGMRNTRKSVLFIGIGLVGLAVGADLAVRGAVAIGARVGLSTAVIGQTIVAVGTSLPELATCVVAAIKGHHDISIGNLVGSNIFNTLLVTGVAGMVRPFEVGPRLVGADYWIMIGVSAAFGLIVVAGRRTIGRGGAALLLCGYVAYLVYLLAYSG
jgi:cation:H+ antiporter